MNASIICLFKFYDVEAIIRIGSAGAYVDDLHLFDLILADSAWSESTYPYAQAGVKEAIMKPSAQLNATIKEAASTLKKELRCARIHSSDVFYHEANVPDHEDFYRDHGCVCVEMESFALFHNAHILGKHAACLLTISDSLVSNEEISAQQRERSFDEMMILGLQSASAWMEKGGQ